MERFKPSKDRYKHSLPRESSNVKRFQTLKGSLQTRSTASYHPSRGVFQTLKGSLQTCSSDWWWKRRRVVSNPQRIATNSSAKMDLPLYYWVSNPQRIATNSTSRGAYYSESRFQTLKGSLQTLRCTSRLIRGSSCFKPSKDRYKLFRSKLFWSRCTCFKPSKDRYKPILTLFCTSSLTSFKPSKDRYKRTECQEGFCPCQVSNPQRIATNSLDPGAKVGDLLFQTLKGSLQTMLPLLWNSLLSLRFQTLKGSLQTGGTPPKTPNAN